MIAHASRRALARSLSVALLIAAAGCSGTSSLPDTAFRQTQAVARSGALAGGLESAAAISTADGFVSPDSTHGTRNDPVNANGGDFKLPKYGGFSGNMQYGSNGGQLGDLVQFEVATTNIFGAPKPPTGKPVVYVSYAADANIIFNNGNQTMQVASKALVNGKSYGVYGYNGSQQFLVPEQGTVQNHIFTFASPIDQTEVMVDGYTYVLVICSL